MSLGNLLKDHARRLSRRFGIDLVRTHTTYEGHLARLLKALDVNLVLDVGAHHGEFASLLRTLGFVGAIISFEPLATSFDRLEAAMKHDPQWQGHFRALGASPGVLNLHVTAATDQSSFLSPSALSGEVFGDATVVRRDEQVTVARLDDLKEDCVRGLQDPRIFLKLDTQGFDWEVVQGGRQTIDQYVVGLQTEIAVQPLYNGQACFPRNIQPFLDLGFEATGLFAVSRDRELLTALEYDLVLRRALPVRSSS